MDCQTEFEGLAANRLVTYLNLQIESSETMDVTKKVGVNEMIKKGCLTKIR